jgi:hypothetical protein
MRRDPVERKCEMMFLLAVREQRVHEGFKNLNCVAFTDASAPSGSCSLSDFSAQWRPAASPWARCGAQHAVHRPASGIRRHEHAFVLVPQQAFDAGTLAATAIGVASRSVTPAADDNANAAAAPLRSL